MPKIDDSHECDSEFRWLARLAAHLDTPIPALRARRCRRLDDVRRPLSLTLLLPAIRRPELARETALGGFHPKVLRQQVRLFNLPQQTGVWQPKLHQWAGLIISGRADELKKTDFLTDIFCGLLG